MRLQTMLEARWILGILLLLALVSWLFSAWVSLFLWMLIFYTVFFFRDPKREIPSDPNAVVAAADGTVADVSDVEETDHLPATSRRPVLGCASRGLFGEKRSHNVGV